MKPYFLPLIILKLKIFQILDELDVNHFFHDFGDVDNRTIALLFIGIVLNLYKLYGTYLETGNLVDGQ